MRMCGIYRIWTKFLSHICVDVRTVFWQCACGIRSWAAHQSLFASFFAKFVKSFPMYCSLSQMFWCIFQCSVTSFWTPNLRNNVSAARPYCPDAHMFSDLFVFRSLKALIFITFLLINVLPSNSVSYTVNVRHFWLKSCLVPAILLRKLHRQAIYFEVLCWTDPHVLIRSRSLALEIEKFPPPNAFVHFHFVNNFAGKFAISWWLASPKFSKRFLFL